MKILLLHGINLNEIRLLSVDRTKARRALGLDRTDVVICTVGNSIWGIEAIGRNG